MLSTKPHKVLWKNRKKPTGSRKTKQDGDEEGRSVVHVAESTLMTLTSLAPWVINNRKFVRKCPQSENHNVKKKQVYFMYYPTEIEPRMS